MKTRYRKRSVVWALLLLRRLAWMLQWWKFFFRSGQHFHTKIRSNNGAKGFSELKRCFQCTLNWSKQRSAWRLTTRRWGASSVAPHTKRRPWAVAAYLHWQSFILNMPPFSKCFLRTLHQMDTCQIRIKSNRFRKLFTWLARLRWPYFSMTIWILPQAYTDAIAYLRQKHCSPHPHTCCQWPLCQTDQDKT